MLSGSQVQHLDQDISISPLKNHIVSYVWRVLSTIPVPIHRLLSSHNSSKGNLTWLWKQNSWQMLQFWKTAGHTEYTLKSDCPAERHEKVLSPYLSIDSIAQHLYSIHPKFSAKGKGGVTSFFQFCPGFLAGFVVIIADVFFHIS